jgi:L-alanine-DL-glutamate epimerase-like enolase superfamily enzyme
MQFDIYDRHSFVMVREKPGLWITLNDEIVKQHLLEPRHFEPTPESDAITQLP